MLTVRLRVGSQRRLYEEESFELRPGLGNGSSLAERV